MVQIGKFLWTRCKDTLRFCHCYQTFVSPLEPSWENRAIGVVDMSQALPPPTQVEFSTWFLLQILIKAPPVNSGLIVL